MTSSCSSQIFAHQLLHDVLQGDQALGAAVLVHHDDHVGLLLLEDAQQVGDLGVSGGVEHIAHKGAHILPAVEAGGVEILLVDHAHHVVDVLMVDRDAGEAALGEDPGDLVHGVGVLHRHDVHPGGDDLLHLQVVELDGGPDELALVLVQPALGLGLVHHGDQLLLGDAVVGGVMEELGEQALPLAEEEVGRGEDHHEKAQQGRREHGEGLGGLLGQALGEISPKTRITTVSTTVETAGPLCASSRSTKKRVDTVVAEMFTMLLPIRMVERSLS